MELSVLANVVAHLQNVFVDVYKACDKGKDKFLRFQLKWYAHCSFTLIALIGMHTVVLH